MKRAASHSTAMKRTAIDWVCTAITSAIVIVLMACALASIGSAQTAPPSVVVIVVDDLGWNDLAAAQTPVLDFAAASARVYTQHRSCPVCSPSRLGMQFGRLPHRDGIGSALDPNDPNTVGAPVSLACIAERAKCADYATGLFGKWHLTGSAPGLVVEAPRVQGYDVWRAGSLGSIVPPESHYGWTRVDDGLTMPETRYSAQAITTEFSAWWGLTAGPKLATICYATPHSPFEAPPSNLLPPGYVVGSTNRDKFLAAVTALDTLLLDIALCVDLSSTYVVLVCDNGTPSQVADPLDPSAGFKGTVYDGGIRTPLIVWGPGVVPGIDTSLVQSSDIAATVLDLMGVPAAPGMLDSVSFEPTLFGAAGSRSASFSHFFRLQPGPTIQTNLWAVVDAAGYKLVHIDQGGPITDELFDLNTDPNETTPITNPAIEAALASYASSVLGTWPL